MTHSSLVSRAFDFGSWAAYAMNLRSQRLHSGPRFVELRVTPQRMQAAGSDTLVVDLASLTAACSYTV